MGLGCKIGKKTVRFDDLTPAAWMEVERGCKSDWAQIYVAPMSDLEGALLLVAECVKVVEPDVDAMARANELASSLGKMAKLWVDVDDDLPHEFADGVPKEVDADSTTSSSSS